MAEMRRQPNSRQDLAVAPLQRLDGTKRRAIFQSQSGQGFVIAVDRKRTDTPLPDMIEMRSGGLTIPRRVLLARHAHHMGSPHIDAICTGAYETKLGCRIAQR